MHEHWAKPVFFPMDKKMISPQIKWFIEKCPGLCTFQNKQMVPKVDAFLRSCFAFWDTLNS